MTSGCSPGAPGSRATGPGADGRWSGAHGRADATPADPTRNDAHPMRVPPDRPQHLATVGGPANLGVVSELLGLADDEDAPRRLAVGGDAVDLERHPWPMGGGMELGAGVGRENHAAGLLVVDVVDREDLWTALD